MADLQSIILCTWMHSHSFTTIKLTPIFTILFPGRYQTRHDFKRERRIQLYTKPGQCQARPGQCSDKWSRNIPRTHKEELQTSLWIARAPTLRPTFSSLLLIPLAEHLWLGLCSQSQVSDALSRSIAPRVPYKTDKGNLGHSPHTDRLVWISLDCSTVLWLCECDYPISLAIDTANQRVVIKNSPSQHTFHNISFELSLNLSASSQAIKWERKITTRTCHCCLLTLTQNQFAGDATYLCEFQNKLKLRQRSWAQSQRESLTNYYISFYNARIDQARPKITVILRRMIEYV